MDNRSKKLIVKYALILSFFFVLEQLFRSYIREFVNSDMIGKHTSFYATVPYAFSFMLNVVTGFIVFKDKQRLNIGSRYLLLATILYKPVGVCAFLLFSILDESKRSETN